MKRRLLFIGSKLDGLAAGFRDRRSVIAHIYSGFDMPPQDVLDSTDAAFVFEVDQFGRFEQLRRLCHWSRQHGQIKLIIGYSQNLDACLAEWVEAAGARFVPLLGGSW